MAEHTPTTTKLPQELDASRLFDFEQMDDIMLGTPDELVKLLQGFFKDTYYELNHMLKQSLETEEDQRQLLDRLHTLKGISGSFGLRGFAKFTAEMESELKMYPQSSNTTWLLKQLKRVLEISERELRSLRPNYLPETD